MGTPKLRSATRWVTGSVPREERETKPSWNAGHTPVKNCLTESPCRRASTGYTTSITRARPT